MHLRHVCGRQWTQGGSCRILASNVPNYQRPPPVRIVRLLLVVLLIAWLPVQGWAGVHTSGPDSAGTATLVTESVALAGGVMNDLAGPDPAGPADDTSPQQAASPDTADPAEHLLPVRPVATAHTHARATVPRYAGNPPPDPDLPRLPRPPRG